MSDLSVPSSKTDAPSARGVQIPGGCNPPTADAHDPGGHGPHRVEPIAPNQLTSYGGNARTHSKRQIEQIAASIEDLMAVSAAREPARSREQRFLHAENRFAVGTAGG